MYEEPVAALRISLYFIFLLFGIFIGCHIGVTQTRKEAINHNAAYWTVDKEGVTTFNWKTSIEEYEPK
jgi:hypothetical protein